MIFEILQNLKNTGSVDFLSVFAQILSLLFVVVCVLPLHELAHGFVAYKLGDPTAKNMGRLTLNPIASLDKRGIICLLLFSFGWAKPVPVNPRYFKNPKRGMALVALAGPLSNFLAAYVGAILWIVAALFLPQNTIALFVVNVLRYYVIINISLAAFNLLPIPPLDGSHILEAFLSDRMVYAIQRYRNAFSLVLLVLLVTGGLSGPLYKLQNFFAGMVLAAAKLPFWLFGVLS